MGEADITEQIVMMMDLTLAGISVFFSIVSAYIVALFYFLHRAPLGFRLVAFVFFSLTLLFLAAFAANCFTHAAALQEALVELSARQPLSAVGAAAVHHGPADRAFLDEVIRFMSWLGMGLVFATLAYFTFWHRWRDRAGDDRTPAMEAGARAGSSE
ncbi:MAG: hypothetical protein GC153_11285 [Alphaproteobacteria bacterium]|nr:hypothetical protein [Alphaproteobacteria bacterium]